MKRRNFLRTLGISALAVPIAIEAVKGIEVPKENNLIEQVGKYEKEYTNNWIRIQEHIEQGFDWQTINLIAPVEPSKAGEAIYLYTDKDNARLHDVIHIPAKYFDWYEITLTYLVVGSQNVYGDAIVADCFTTMTGLPVYKYKCLPLKNDLALTKEIPVTQKLIIGASVSKPEEL